MGGILACWRKDGGDMEAKVRHMVVFKLKHAGGSAG